MASHGRQPEDPATLFRELADAAAASFVQLAHERAAAMRWASERGLGIEDLATDEREALLVTDARLRGLTEVETELRDLAAMATTSEGDALEECARRFRDVLARMEELS